MDKAGKSRASARGSLLRGQGEEPPESSVAYCHAPDPPPLPFPSPRSYVNRQTASHIIDRLHLDGPGACSRAPQNICTDAPTQERDRQPRLLSRDWHGEGVTQPVKLWALSPDRKREEGGRRGLQEEALTRISPEPNRSPEGSVFTWFLISSLLTRVVSGVRAEWARRMTSAHHIGHGREARRGQRCAGTACGDACGFVLRRAVEMDAWLRKGAGQSDGLEEAGGMSLSLFVVAARLGAHRRAGQTLPAV